MEKQENISQEYERLFGFPPIVPISFAILIVVFIAILLILACIFIPFVIDALGLGLILLMSLGIVYVGIRIWKYLRRIEIKDIPPGGTIIRLPNGKLQIIAPIEIFAFETSDKVVSVQEIPEYYKNQIAGAEPFPSPFPSDMVDQAVSGGVYTETALETPDELESRVAYVEPVMSLLEDEATRAKIEQEAKQDELTKKRIATLASQGFSLRVISKIVHLEGRKYAKFQQLCRELGINAD